MEGNLPVMVVGAFDQVPGGHEGGGSGMGVWLGREEGSGGESAGYGRRSVQSDAREREVRGGGEICR